MMVADIYDALIATDRPYRPADSPDRALEILRDEALSGAIDADVLDLFIEYEVYKLITPAHPGLADLPGAAARAATSVLPGT
jgi:HD-GYP domain-containing protein (c-di-GMP phosphodiesterase class II)